MDSKSLSANIGTIYIKTPEQHIHPQKQVGLRLYSERKNNPKKREGDNSVVCMHLGAHIIIFILNIKLKLILRKPQRGKIKMQKNNQREK